MARFLNALLIGGGQLARAVGINYPAPSFTVLPAINPASGMVGGTFAAADATVVGGVVTARRWLLTTTGMGTTVIGTGLTVTPQTAGSLVLENTAIGLGGTVVATSAGVTVSAAGLPALTITGALAFTVGAATGTVVANIGNVFAGVTPTLTPNDGRLAVAGDATNGWKVVVGMTASSAGTIALTVSATGATAASANVTVTNATSAAITSPASVAQPGATQRFFRATADRAGSWSLGTGGNVADFAIDATTGIYNVKASAAGDGTAQIVKTVPLVFTPADGSGAVTQTVSVTLAPAAAPGQLSSSATYTFAGTAGTRLDQLAGWATNNGQPGNAIVLDGNGALVQGASKSDAQEYLTRVPKLAGAVVTWRIAVGDGMLGLVLASDGAGNKIEVLIQTQGSGGGGYIPGNQFFTTQGGTATQNGTANLYTTYNIAGGQAVDFRATFSPDGKSVTIGFVGGTASTTLDLTGLTLGKGFGFGFERYNGWPVYSAARISQVQWTVAATGLAVVSVPALSYSNQAVSSLTWDTTLAMPAGIQHSFDGATWFTGDSTINNDGTISYTATAPSAGSLNLSFRALSDTNIGAAAVNKTRFLATSAKFGSNLVESGGWSVPYNPQFQVFDNLLISAYWQDTSNNNPPIYPRNTPGRVDADNMPLAAGMKLQIPHGPVSGGTLEMTWTGSPNMAVVLQATAGNTVLSNLTRPTAQSIRLTETFSYDGGATPGGTFGGIVFTGMDPSDPPKNITIRSVGQAAPQYPPFTDAYIALMRTFNGPLRMMDVLDTNGQVDGSATFSKHRQLIEWTISLANATGRDPWWCIPIYASDAYITAVAQAFDKGTGTSNGVALKAGLSIWWEWGNEVWNSAFAAYGVLINKYVARTGESQLPDNGGGVEQRFKEHAFQHNHAMSVVEAAMPSYASRAVRVIATKTGTYNYETFKGLGAGAHYDAHAQAPYFFVNSNSDQTPAGLLAAWKKAGLDEIAFLASAANETYADGKRYVCYESGPDFRQSDLSLANRIAFKASQQYYDVMRAYFGAWVSSYGDVNNAYTDIGVEWGLLSYQGNPNPSGYSALIDTIAGSTTHRPAS